VLLKGWERKWRRDDWKGLSPIYGKGNRSRLARFVWQKRQRANGRVRYEHTSTNTNKVWGKCQRVPQLTLELKDV